MFIIVQDVLSYAHEEMDYFDCFDILTSPTGFPIIFPTLGEALTFLSSLGIDGDTLEVEEGEIRIDRLH
jgi:hypothetical protein|tara:strand:+ start:210 stop:416 length:207 start_codon:yes stop_codon:yes gene_type:complete